MVIPHPGALALNLWCRNYYTSPRYAGGMGHNPVNDEQMPEQQLAERVTVELCGSAGDMSALEQTLADLDGTPGIALHEIDPSITALRSSAWEVIVVSAASTGALKVLRDVLVAHIASRRVKISVTRSETGKSVTFEGHTGNRREVEQLVREITAEKPSD